MPIAAYRPIDSRSSYNTKRFVKSFGDLRGLERVLTAIREKETPDLAWLGKTLYGDPGFFDTCPETAGENALAAYTAGFIPMMEYVEKNRKKFASFLRGEKDLEKVILSVNLCRNGNRTHDEYVEAVENYKEAQAVFEKANDESKKSDPKLVEKYIEKRAKKDADWMRKLVEGLKNTRYMDVVFVHYVDYDKKRFKLVTGGKKKKFNSARAADAIVTSLEEARKEHRKIPSGKRYSKERQESLASNIYPYYLALADAAFSSETRKKKQKKDAGEIERKKRREEKGLAA